MRLHGADIDETTTVLEAGLGWIVGWDKPSFVGSEALHRQRASGVARTIVGFEMRDRAIARHGYIVSVDGEKVGVRVERYSDTVPEKGDRHGLPARRARHGRRRVRCRRPWTPRPGRDRPVAVLQAPEGLRSMYPPEFKYTKDHEWLGVSDDRARVGITDYAQTQLGDVVFVELPEIGQRFKQGDQFGSIESVKAVSDLYCPVSGEVVEVNAALVKSPEQVNSDPYGAWMIVLKLANPDEVARLLDNEGYAELVK